MCSREENGFCTIKKVKVHINKDRKCDKYKHDQSKFKPKRKTPSVFVSYVEQQNGKRVAKKQLKKLQKLVKDNPGNKLARDLGLHDSDPKYIDSIPTTSDIKHPTTGDLSRFTTTATKGNKED